jgi:hypothetical protein
MCAIHVLFTCKTLVTSNTPLAEVLILILIHLSKPAGDTPEIAHLEKFCLFSRFSFANHFYFNNTSFLPKKSTTKGFLQLKGDFVHRRK